MAEELKGNKSQRQCATHSSAILVLTNFEYSNSIFENCSFFWIFELSVRPSTWSLSKTSRNRHPSSEDVSSMSCSRLSGSEDVSLTSYYNRAGSRTADSVRRDLWGGGSFSRRGRKVIRRWDQQKGASQMDEQGNRRTRKSSPIGRSRPQDRIQKTRRRHRATCVHGQTMYLDVWVLQNPLSFTRRAMIIE